MAPKPNPEPRRSPRNHQSSTKAVNASQPEQSAVPAQKSTEKRTSKAPTILRLHVGGAKAPSQPTSEKGNDTIGAPQTQNLMRKVRDKSEGALSCLATLRSKAAKPLARSKDEAKAKVNKKSSKASRSRSNARSAPPVTTVTDVRDFVYEPRLHNDDDEACTRSVEPSKKRKLDGGSNETSEPALKKSRVTGHIPLAQPRTNEQCSRPLKGHRSVSAPPRSTRRMDSVTADGVSSTSTETNQFALSNSPTSSSISSDASPQAASGLLHAAQNGPQVASGYLNPFSLPTTARHELLHVSMMERDLAKRVHATSNAVLEGIEHNWHFSPEQQETARTTEELHYRKRRVATLKKNVAVTLIEIEEQEEEIRYEEARVERQRSKAVEEQGEWEGEHTVRAREMHKRRKEEVEERGKEFGYYVL